MGGTDARHRDPTLLGSWPVRERRTARGAGETRLSSGDAAERMVTALRDWGGVQGPGRSEAGGAGRRAGGPEGPRVLPRVDPVWVTGDLLGKRNSAQRLGGLGPPGTEGLSCRHGRAS